MRRLIIGLAVVLFGVGQTQAELVIDYDTTIDYRIDEDVSIIAATSANQPTIVSFAEGAELHGVLTIHDDGTAYISGGSFSNEILASESSTVHVSGGVFDLPDDDDDDDPTIRFGTAHISGGVFTVDILRISGGNISGGVFAVDDYFGARNVSISGGVFVTDDFLVSHADISGGSFAAVSDLQMASTTIYGTGFNYGYGPIAEPGGRLTGILRNGDPIDVHVEIEDDDIVILAVPEPSTLAMLACGLIGLLWWRRRRL